MALERILVAYDGSEAAFRALEQAVEAGQADEAQIDLVVVRTSSLVDPDAVASDAVSYLCEHGFDPVVHVRLGDPAGTIRHLADEDGYDAVYLGTRGHASHVQDDAPSVSASVVELAHVTTVVAR